MIKLVRGTLGQELKFRPERTRISLSERGSTCAPQIGPDGPEISAGDWLQSEDGPAQGTVWIVKKIDQQVESRTWTIQAEHAINLLRRRILPGEVKPEDMGGSATGCTARQAAAYILGRQSDWVLGDCDFSDSHPYSFDGEDLFSALETVSDSLDGCLWEYDFSVYPFRLHLRRGSDSIDSEIRMSRNAHTIRRTIDTQDTCTRFYPVGKENLRLPGAGYVSRNEGLYGVFEKTDTDESMDSAAKLTDWADGYLRRHAQPLVTIVVDGLELARDTGESLDRFQVGRMCRIPLAEYGEAAVTERINKIDYPDAEGEADKCTITIGGEIDDIAKIVSRMQKKSGGGGRASARNAEEDHAWIEDTTEHVYLVAEALVGKDPSGNPVDWSRVSVLGVDGTGIHGRVTVAEGELVQQESRIDATETAITTEVTDRTNADTQLSSRITQTANAITAEVTRATNAEGEMSGRISVEAGKISQIVSAVGADGEVTAASIVLAINQSTGQSEAKIDAGHVYIGNEKSTTVISGKLTADDITAEFLNAKIATIPVLSVSSLYVSGTINSDGYVYAPNFVIGSNSSGGGGNKYLSNAVIGVDVSGNTLTLTQANGDVTSFSKATSLSGAWSGNGLTVTATPQDEKYYQYITTGAWQNEDGSAYSSGNKFYIPILAYGIGTPPVYTQVERASVDASSIYTAGYNVGSPNGTVTIGTKITGTNYNISISRSDGTAVAGTKDFSSIYADARDGYTAGTFTRATVILQGARVTGTAYHTVDTGGTVFYTAGSSVTAIGSSVTPITRTGYYRGTEVSMSRDTIYRKIRNTYSEIGYCYYCNSNNGASKMYKGGSYFTHYDVGSEDVLYHAGSSVTQISGGTRMMSVVAYQAGSTDSTTYYKKS